MHALKVGIIGLGRIGKLHAENIKKYLPEIELIAVADPVLDETWIQDMDITHVFTTPQALLEMPEIEAVIICTPVDSHVSLIIEAANLGKHIFCEKPLSLDIDEINIVLETVHQAKVKLQVGFNRRFDENFMQIKQAIIAGRIGEPHFIKITSRDPELPSIKYLKNSGGLFLDMTIHDFDMARYLTNSEISEIYVDGEVLIDSAIAKIGDIDTAIINLKFENGMLGVIDNSRQAVYGYDQRIEVFGSKGNIQAENNRPTNVCIRTNQQVSFDKPFHFFLERYRQSYINEIQAFYHAIKQDTGTPVTGHDGLMPVIIGLAANESLKMNKPIQIEQAALV